jgi:SpoVK/Ycf46/Vps4 family AAA+-type ATPase
MTSPENLLAESLVLGLPLAQAGIFRDVLFDLWAQIKDHPGSFLRLHGQALTLQGLKEALATLDSGETPVDRKIARPEAEPMPGRPGRDLGAGREQPEAAIPPTSYADIGGLDQAMQELREALELPLKHHEVLSGLGLPLCRGVLLYGPPGCGKTLMARAVAHESGAKFFAVSGPELISKWHGESEENLRKLFSQAQKHQPSIVFFDEIDAVAQARSADESLRLDSRFTAQLLTIMDGIFELGRVFVLGATNRMDLLDQALLRPGRFDRIIAVPLPGREGRLSILNIHASGLPLAQDVGLKELAEALEGASGADIAHLVREAAYACLRRCLNLSELLEAPAPLGPDILAGLRVDREDFRTALEGLRRRGQALNAAPPGQEPE